MGTFPHSSCASKVRGIQNFHMDVREWNDGAYSAIVCPHGFVFELRGPGVRTAANGTNLGNNTGHAVCYLGGVGDPFTREGMAGIQDAYRWCRRGFANCHRDWKPTACPGDVICSWVKAGGPQQGTSVPDPQPEPEPEPLTLGEPMDCFTALVGSINDAKAKFTQFWVVGKNVMYMSISKETAEGLATPFLGNPDIVPIRQVSQGYVDKLKAAPNVVKLG